MPVGESFEVVAYVTVTDQPTGTHLIKVDELGKIDMCFIMPARPDLINPSLSRNRVLLGSIGLEDEIIIAH